MYFDLNVPIPQPSANPVAQTNKGKGKQFQPHTSPLFTPAQLAAIQTRLDLLVHRASFPAYTTSLTLLIGGPVGYSVLAFNQCIKSKVEPKTFINTLDPLLRQMKKRPGVVYLKRLTIVLDEDSEKGFGLVRSNFLCHPSCVANTTPRRQTRSPICSVLTTSSHLHQPRRVASPSHA
jgi:ribonuclease P/MRP protein subunit RPP1